MRRALSEDRPFLVASLILAIGFPFLRDGSLGDIFLMAWKAGAVACLAVYALRRLSGKNAYLLVLYLSLSALGDALMIIDMLWGGAAFFAAHVFAITMFAAHRRAKLTSSQLLLAILLCAATPLLAYIFMLPETQWPVMLYCCVLGVMAALAWTSAYPRYQVGIGALLFVASDLLIFGSMGILANVKLASILVWPLYYIGQLMMCTGIVRVLRAK